jgi:hypothetical protein
MVHYGELNRAGAFLNTLNAQTEEQSDFVDVQQINLAYLAHPADYELSEIDRSYLFSVGTSDGAFNGYARALYEVLTGERIEVEIPEVGGQERNDTDDLLTGLPLISAYPNPSANGIFTLKIGHLSQNTTYDVMLNDATGRLWNTTNISKEGTYSLGNEQMPSGIYFLTIRDDSNNTLFQSKLVILN